MWFLFLESEGIATTSDTRRQRVLHYYYCGTQPLITIHFAYEIFVLLLSLTLDIAGEILDPQYNEDKEPNQYIKVPTGSHALSTNMPSGVT